MDAKSERVATSTARPISDAVQRGKIQALFQPIEALRTGECHGFEALARLQLDDGPLAPDAFLPHLDDDDRLGLFGTMLGEAIALLKSLGVALGRPPSVSINVEISLIASEIFVDVLRYFLERHDFSGERLVLEILENEEVTDLTLLRERLDAVRGLGLSVALDDIGSGFASLAKIKQLPLDIVKLDRDFCRDLQARPDDLMFVMSMQSLARGLGKRLVVEGVETPEVYDGLRLIGVEFGQGFAIARPMPASEVAAWLAGRTHRVADRIPRCMFGAYASHLSVVESCRLLRHQPLPIAWTEAAADSVNCSVGQYFRSGGWSGTACDTAHAAFHAALPFYETDPVRWTESAHAFQVEMAAIIASGRGKIAATRAVARRAIEACTCQDGSGLKAAAVPKAAKIQKPARSRYASR